MGWVDENGIDSDIAYMFYSENQEKKNIGRNIYHRAATRKGRLNKMNFPCDFMSKKDRNAYKKPGKVVITNMYDDIKMIPMYSEIEKMEYSNAKALIETLKAKHSVKDICKQWVMSNYTFYHSVVPKYKIPTVDRVKRVENRKGSKNKNQNTANKELAITSTEKIIDMQTKEVYVPVPLIEKEFEGFRIQFAGKYIGEKLVDRIMNYIGTVDKESNYQVKLVIEEL